MPGTFQMTDRSRLFGKVPARVVTFLVPPKNAPVDRNVPAPHLGTLPAWCLVGTLVLFYRRGPGGNDLSFRLERSPGMSVTFPPGGTFLVILVTLP